MNYSQYKLFVIALEPTPYNLDLWNDLENSDKNIFAGMYQFWCQKA